MKRVWLIPARDFLPLYIINASPLPAATQGVFYSTQMQANGGAAPYVWSLPATNGFTINAASGLISGTPVSIEVDSLSITVTDSLGAIVTRPFSVTVNANSTTLAITTTSPLPSGNQGSAYSQTMVATGGTPPYTWSFFAAPSGSNTWNISSGGVVTGTPANIETDSLPIRVTDSLSAHADGTFTLQVLVANNFFSDPYSGYPTFLVDPVHGVDTPGGAPFSQTWGGVTQVWNCFATLPYAVTNYFTGAGRRLGLLASTTYTLGSVVAYPQVLTGTLSPTAQRVLQGDPSATAGTLPSIQGNGPGGTAYSLLELGFVAHDDSYSVFRKFDLSNGNGTGIHIGVSAGFAIVEFCEIHGLTLTPADNIGGVYVVGTPPGVIIRNNKIHDILESAGAGGGWGVLSFNTTSMLIDHNEFWGSGSGVFSKGPPSGNGWTVSHNIFRDTVLSNQQGAVGGMLMSFNQANNPWHDWFIFGNLFYNIVHTAMNAPPPDIVQGTTLSFTNNTIAQDCGACVTLSALDHVTLKDNIILGPAVGGTSLQFNHNGTPAFVVFTQCDYNFYYTPNFAVQDDRNGPSSLTVHTFNSGAAGNRWSTFHTDYPARTVVTTDPDAHGGPINSFVNGPSDVNFVDPSVRNYGLKNTSPLKGTSSTGGDPGYDPNNIGPGW